jgi:hypothetical protein
LFLEFGASGRFRSLMADVAERDVALLLAQSPQVNPLVDIGDVGQPTCQFDARTRSARRQRRLAPFREAVRRAEVRIVRMLVEVPPVSIQP